MSSSPKVLDLDKVASVGKSPTIVMVTLLCGPSVSGPSGYCLKAHTHKQILGIVVLVSGWQKMLYGGSFLMGEKST